MNGTLVLRVNTIKYHVSHKLPTKRLSKFDQNIEDWYAHSSANFDCTCNKSDKKVSRKTMHNVAIRQVPAETQLGEIEQPNIYAHTPVIRTTTTLSIISASPP